MNGERVNDDKLIRMANDIAAFFKSYGEADAVAGIRHHIESFWTPKMRADLAGCLATGSATNLSPLASAALRASPPRGGPAERETAGPATAGEVGASDAG